MKIAGHVTRWSMELRLPVWAGKQDLLPSALSNGAWRHAETLEVVDQEC
jgi:hypothetical protein